MFVASVNISVKYDHQRRVLDAESESNILLFHQIWQKTLDMMPEAVLVYNRKKKSVHHINSVVQEIFKSKKSETKMSLKNVDTILK